MEILQLPMMALQERIDAELASNPVLELRDGGDERELQRSDSSPPQIGTPEPRIGKPSRLSAR